MRRLLFSILTLLCTVSLMAVPAMRIKKTIMLTDGTKVTATFMGDEHLSYFVADDGRAFLPTANNRFCAVSRDSLQLLRQQRLSRFNAPSATGRRAKVAGRSNIKARREANKANFTGNKKGLVLLVEFTDNQFSETNPVYTFSRFFNEEGYTDNGMYGSVHDYFYSQSYGQFNLTFDVVGPLKLSKTESYYGSRTEANNDAHPAEMARETIDLAEKSGVDFSKYDWDGDGEVDQVFIVYAGYGEAQGASGYTIWPHEWYLSSGEYYGDGAGAVEYDGVTIDKYACGNELQGTSGTKLAGIGTACHEFSHCLGLPDFYDTSEDGSVFGMYTWDLLDHGCWSNSGYCPTAYTSFERWYAGWLEPTELAGPLTVQGMPALVDSPSAYILYNDNNENEFYMLENRQKSGWDSYVSGHGLLILHVNYVQSTWSRNQVNNDGINPGMTVIPADNMLTDGSCSGDTYPYDGNNELTNSSTPEAKLYTENTDGTKFMNKPIEQITESGGQISFVAMDGFIPVPEPELGDFSYAKKTFTIQWDAIDGAQKYNIYVTEKKGQQENPDSAVLLKEDFVSTCVQRGAVQSNIGLLLNKYLTTQGWPADKSLNNYVYPTKSKGLQMGKGSNLGMLTTPTLKAPDTGDLTIVATTSPYKTSFRSQVKLTVGSSTASGGISGDANHEAYILYAEGINDDFSLTFSIQSADNIYYMEQLNIYDGYFTAEQLGIETDEDEESAPVLQITREADEATAQSASSTFSTHSSSAKGTAPRKATSRTLSTNEPKYTFTDVTTNATYVIRVSAVTADGESNQSAALTICLDELTGINDLPASASTTHPVGVYDLSGRRVTSPVRGLYIKDCKKYLVR